MGAAMPPLFIRADADRRIGSGHVMRCLALAQEWQGRGGEVVFLGRISNDQLRRRIVTEGRGFHSISASHPSPQDWEEVGGWLREQKQKGWLVVDGYHFDGDYHKAVRALGWSLMVIDDYAHLPLYASDILLNPNAHAKELSYHTSSGTVRLLGTRYTPLRREFREAAQRPGEMADLGRRILVTMGGADPGNVSGRVMDFLLAMNAVDLEVKIVIGPLNPHRYDLETRLQKAPFQVELLTMVENMAPLMRWADLAISAAGSTCWELAALGVPTVVTILADNQEGVASSLVDHGAAINLGWYYNWHPGQTAKTVAKVLEDQETRKRMSEQGKKLVDGRGSERIIRNLLQSTKTVILRPVTDSDCHSLFEWVNDPAVRAASFCSAPIGWEEHIQWFLTKMRDVNCLHFIAENEQGEAIGQVRFDITQEEAEIDISIDKGMRGLGYAPILIRHAISSLRQQRDIRAVHAFVKHDNSASIKSFGKAGFRNQGVANCRHHGGIHFVYR